jgi:hypothetical protein
MTGLFPHVPRHLGLLYSRWLFLPNTHYWSRLMVNVNCYFCAHGMQPGCPSVIIPSRISCNTEFDLTNDGITYLNHVACNEEFATTQVISSKAWTCQCFKHCSVRDSGTGKGYILAAASVVFAPEFRHQIPWWCGRSGVDDEITLRYEHWRRKSHKLFPLYIASCKSALYMDPEIWAPDRI